MTAYYGKYRGKVDSNVDPLGQGRLLVSVPAISAVPLSWAMPCTPYGGDGVGLFVLPPKGANVWVEFEQGDANYPIWSGTFWAAGQAPVMLGDAEVRAWRTKNMSVLLDERKEELVLRFGEGPNASEVCLDGDGIRLTVGKSELRLKPDAIESLADATKLSVAASAIELSCGQGTAVIEDGKCEAAGGGALIKLNGSTAKFTNGQASVELARSSTKINSDGLVVD